MAGLWQSSPTIKERAGCRRHRAQGFGLDQPIKILQEHRIHAPEAVSTRGSNTRAWNYRRRPSLALPAASGVVPIRPLRVSGSARDIPLVPEPGTAWRQELRRHDLTEGKASLALKGLATRKPMLLFSFDGSLLLRFEEARLLSLLFQEPPRSPRDEPDIFMQDDAPVFCHPTPPRASANCPHGSHG